MIRICARACTEHFTIPKAELSLNDVITISVFVFLLCVHLTTFFLNPFKIPFQSLSHSLGEVKWFLCCLNEKKLETFTHVSNKSISSRLALEWRLDNFPSEYLTEIFLLFSHKLHSFSLTNSFVPRHCNLIIDTQKKSHLWKNYAWINSDCRLIM